MKNQVKGIFAVGLFISVLLWGSSCSDHKGKSSNDKKDSTEVVEQAQISTDSIITLTSAEYIKLVADYQGEKDKFVGEKPCIVDFYADWCPPCRALTPVLEQFAQEYAGKIQIYKINVDNSGEVADAYGIQSIPTLFFCKPGSEIKTIVGAPSKEDLKKDIDDLL